MYQEFSIISVKSNLIKKEIIVETNQPLNSNTIDETKIELIERKTKAQASFDRRIEDNNLILTLKDWALPNSVYILFIEDLKNILNESLNTHYSRKIIFTSCITDTVEITSPSMYEEIQKLYIAFNRTNIGNDGIEKAIYVEVSTDNEFYNIVKQSVVFDKDNITLSSVTNGQYYVRARVQSHIEDKDFQYGEWSKTISFVFGAKESKPEKEEDTLDYIPSFEDMTPIIDDVVDYEITCLTPFGTSPDKITLESNKPLDEEKFNRSQIIIYGKEGILNPSIVTVDTIIDITLEKKLIDNEIYNIKLIGIENIYKEKFSGVIKFNTAMKPFYTEVESVRALIGDNKISDDVIAYHIREASKFADYLMSKESIYHIKDGDEVPFVIQQFVKYYAAHECLLRHTIELASSTGSKGVVGNVQFEDKESTKDISKLLEHLCKEVDDWKDAIKGYDGEGRAKMKATVRGINSKPPYQPLGLNGMKSYGRGDIDG